MKSQTIWELYQKNLFELVILSLNCIFCFLCYWNLSKYFKMNNNMKSMSLYSCVHRPKCMYMYVYMYIAKFGRSRYTQTWHLISHSCQAFDREPIYREKYSTACVLHIVTISNHNMQIDMYMHTHTDSVMLILNLTIMECYTLYIVS
jgi:hypothetical protein